MIADHLVILPDTPAADEVYRVRGAESPRLVDHPSGRPWLLGAVEVDDLVVVDEGRTRVVLVGVLPAGTERVRSLLRRVRAAEDLGAVATDLPGSFLLLGSVGGSTWAQGTASGVRGLVRTRIGGVDVAADRADVLAAMTGAGVDEDVLAMRLIGGTLIPPPLGDRPFFSGVTAVAAGDGLVWHDDRACTRTWWRAPEPVRSLEEGAEALRAVLVEAFRGRAPRNGRLGSDLSGGMDSTSLAFLGSAGAPDLVTWRWEESEDGSDDRSFAAYAAGLLPEPST